MRRLSNTSDRTLNETLDQAPRGRVPDRKHHCYCLRSTIGLLAVLKGSEYL